MRFEIIKPIRSGATVVVYLARDTVKGNIVALKQLRPDVAFPQQEVLLAQKVTHPNVCRVHEFFVENGVAQISMEYVEGENLRSVIDRYRAEAASAAVPFDEALGILRQVMDGLEEAHRQGVVHRCQQSRNWAHRFPFGDHDRQLGTTFFRWGLNWPFVPAIPKSGVPFPVWRPRSQIGDNIGPVSFQGTEQR